jgi:ATP-dependent DNA ligase
MNNNGIIEYFSRKGLNYTTLGALDEQVRQILAAASKDGGEYVLDGEVCLLSENNKDDFSGIMKEIKKINHTIANPAYTIFDLIEKNEFLQANGHTSFLTRLNKLEGLNISQYGKFCTVVQNKQSINNADFIT